MTSHTCVVLLTTLPFAPHFFYGPDPSFNHHHCCILTTKMISPVTITTKALALSLDLVAPTCALLALADVVIMLFNGITGSSFALELGSTARTAAWLEMAFWAYSHFQTDTGRQLKPIDVEARKRFWRETMATLDNAASVDTWLCSWFDRKSPPSSLRDRAAGWISGSMDEAEGKVTMAEVKRGNIEEWLSGA